MSRIQSINDANAAITAAQAALAAAQQQLSDAEALPYDQFVSQADGLGDFLDSSGVVQTCYLVTMDNWSGQFQPGQSLLNAINSAPFTQSTYSPASMVTDPQGRLQFLSGGADVYPNPVALHVVKQDPNDGTETQYDVPITWALNG